MREELYSTYLKARGNTEAKSVDGTVHEQVEVKDGVNSIDANQLRKEKQERAVREREAQVKANLLALEADIGRSKMDLDREGGESLFRYVIHLQAQIHYYG